MTTHELKVQQLRDGMDEMEAAVERLRDDIQRLKEERNALERGNLALYQKLTQIDF
jgi:predicted nuclease with TOPRIM domain